MSTQAIDLPIESAVFSEHILTWFEQHGRHHLPWQQHQKTIANPYHVWLSEVMLQQTQVSTVIPYFQRFINTFPTLQDLANANWQAVAELWAGLGYYARARNLHKGAKQLQHIIQQTGDFPQDVAGWQQISGVGQSTAGAVVAMGMRGFGVICDGNVKRVLTRWAGITGDIQQTATNQQLWQLATALTPKTHADKYAQAMMDIGATICTKSNPKCLLCPIQNDCVAHLTGTQSQYPVKSKKAPKPSKHSLVLKLSDVQGKTLWLQRPEQGIWGGLWCLPLQFYQKLHTKKLVATYQDRQTFLDEYTIAEQLIFQFLQQHQLLDLEHELLFQTTIKHSLTHFHWFLTLHQIVLSQNQIDELSKRLTDHHSQFIWADDVNLPMPKAMQKLIH